MASFFLEKGEFDGLLSTLLSSRDAAALEPVVARMCEILSLYQEQAHLLDPHLEGIVGPIMATVRATLRAWHEGRVDALEAAGGGGGTSAAAAAFGVQAYADPVLHRQLQVVYALTKTRGYKRVVKLLPHEVADVEPVVQALVCHDAGEHGTWETRYVLLLWLSILVLMPFPLDTLDSSSAVHTASVAVAAAGGSSGGGGGGGGLIASTIALCTSYLSDPGAVRDAAAQCLARLLTRPDMEAGRLRVFLEVRVLLRPCLEGGAPPYPSRQLLTPPPPPAPRRRIAGGVGRPRRCAVEHEQRCRGGGRGRGGGGRRRRRCSHRC